MDGQTINNIIALASIVVAIIIAVITQMINNANKDKKLSVKIINEVIISKPINYLNDSDLIMKYSDENIIQFGTLNLCIKNKGNTIEASDFLNCIQVKFPRELYIFSIQNNSIDSVPIKPNNTNYGFNIEPISLNKNDVINLKILYNLTDTTINLEKETNIKIRIKGLKISDIKYKYSGLNIFVLLILEILICFAIYAILNQISLIFIYFIKPDDYIIDSIRFMTIFMTFMIEMVRFGLNNTEI